MSKKSAKKTSSKKPFNKTELAAELHSHLADEGHEVHMKVAKAALAFLPEVIASQVKKHGAFMLHGVGKFVARVKPAVKAKTKKVRNPATGEQVWQKPRPASTVVKMRVAKALKDAVA